MIRISAVQGEKPEPVEHTWLDADGNIVDLSGYSCQALWSHAESGSTGTLSGSVDGPAGTSTVTPSTAMLASSGVVYLDMWVGNGVQRYGAKYQFSVAPQVGAPTV